MVPDSLEVLCSRRLGRWLSQRAGPGLLAGVAVLSQTRLPEKLLWSAALYFQPTAEELRRHSSAIYELHLQGYAGRELHPLEVLLAWCGTFLFQEVKTQQKFRDRTGDTYFDKSRFFAELFSTSLEQEEELE